MLQPRPSVAVLLSLVLCACLPVEEPPDDDGDGWFLSGDCNDDDDTVYPGAEERCDGQLNDCNSSMLAGEVDDDGDHYVVCTIDAGGWDGDDTILGGDDCDEVDGTIHPGAAEICDGANNDCDDLNWPTVASDEIDDDGDQYVDCALAVLMEDWKDTGFTPLGGDDCDDTESTVKPTGAEICDGLHNNCSDTDWTSVPPADEIDNDDDTFVECTLAVSVEDWGHAETPAVTGGEDCDDGEDDTYPGADEVVGDGVDQDCNLVDRCYEDGDIDGFGSSTTIDGADLNCSNAGESLVATDCDDTDEFAFPGAAVSDSPTECMRDSDGDSYGDDTSEALFVSGTDCEDANALINPGMAEFLNAVDDDCDVLTDDLDYTFVGMPAGVFQMGSPTDEVGRDPAEEAQHWVTLTRPFYIGATEVTQDQFFASMGYDPSFHGSCGGECPVESLTWHEAAAYANVASTEAGLPSCYACTGDQAAVVCTRNGNPYACKGYRLPTEAEWEYAARAGVEAAFPNGGNLIEGDAQNCTTTVTLDNGDDLGEVGWYCGSSSDEAQPVADLEPNRRGLYDVSGNMREWCHDIHGSYAGDETDPTGAGTGSEAVLRGGGWGSFPESNRLASRDSQLPSSTFSYVGFRLARTAPANTDGDGDGYMGRAYGGSDCHDQDPLTGESVDLTSAWGGTQGVEGIYYESFSGSAFSDMTWVAGTSRWEGNSQSHIRRTDGTLGQDEVFIGHPGSSGGLPWPSPVITFVPTSHTHVGVSLLAKGVVDPVSGSDSISARVYIDEALQDTSEAIPNVWTNVSFDFGVVEAGSRARVEFWSRGSSASDAFYLQSFDFECY
ncbi:MAG: SUMF1/EgtB/PvdO family nonheme iron enzyme [Deltaproteobacteria bacterium]|nr:SUMF1/EgtB/PvdO family nonheme iron enzyme [Deltaproteobacteria bacterium]